MAQERIEVTFHFRLTWWAWAALRAMQAAARLGFDVSEERVYAVVRRGIRLTETKSK